MTASPNRFLRQREVTFETGLPKSTIYFLIARGQFPRPLRLAARAVAWPLADIEAWKSSRKVAA